jgi:hypothetical protein
MNEGFQKNPRYSLPVPIARDLELNWSLPPLGPLRTKALPRSSLAVAAARLKRCHGLPGAVVT